ncbi:MAG: MBL fold metallo-hydrolase [Methylococcaceae bacterium]|nr:MAG: MBL fold metallo-hydrolase [Methylococcaceae bacterium]
MNAIRLQDYQNAQIDLDVPTPLFRDTERQHAVYWLGTQAKAAFRCNVYLIVDGEEAILVDPGSKAAFPQIRRRVAQILPSERITGMILCHQDPDVAASFVDWLALDPAIKVYTTLRTQVLLPHYGCSGYAFVDVGRNPLLRLSSGAELRFIEAPFLHFPGAFTTYDNACRFLFSGDIWGAISAEWRLVLSDFAGHAVKMDMFHIDYMASNIAARGFLRRLEGLDIQAIVPQHGSIIPAAMVAQAKEYLEQLECGLDVVYPELR